MHRRTFLAMAAAAAVSPAIAAPAAAPEFTDAELLDSVFSEIAALGGKKLDTLVKKRIKLPGRAAVIASSLEASFDVPPLTDALKAKLAGQTYWTLKEAERPAPSWPALSAAPDYMHLAPYALATPDFAITGDVLAFLADRNDFPLADETGIVVFGLRGCRIAGGNTHQGWASAHLLEVAAPTHLAPRCVMGLWRKSDNAVAVFRASTVPAAHNMFTSLAANGNGTSLLPTGLYTYLRGDHKASKPDRVHRGALLIQGLYPVLRTAAELAYDPFKPTTAWTRGAAHNIHAAGMGDVYDSAGCQVVHGNYIKPGRIQTKGAWDEFRRLAGTVDAFGTAPPATAQKTFRYMLLTGLEAALAAQGGADFSSAYRPLRFGSKGARVAELQTRLMAELDAPPVKSADGGFGLRTAFGAIMDSKRVYGDNVTGIVQG